MTDAENVVQFDPMAAIGARIDAAYKRTREGRQEWIEGSLDLAAALIEGRRDLTNKEFGKWLKDNGHDHVGAPDRAALLKMGSDPDTMRAVLTESASISWQLIWNGKRDLFNINIKTDPTPTQQDHTNVVKTGRGGPWTNVIDDRLADLFGRGLSKAKCAVILNREFSPAKKITTNMVVNALRRLLLAPSYPPRAGTPRQRGSRSGSRGPIRISTRPSLAPMTREQVDPDWDLPDSEWVARHGHVHAMTAVQKAAQLFGCVADELRAAAKPIQDANPPGRHRATMDAYWLARLRSPKPRDIARLTEALEYLRPRIAEAEAALARAIEAQAPVEPPVAATGAATGDLARAE